MSRIFKALERAEAERARAASDAVRPTAVAWEAPPEIDVPWRSHEYERLKVMLALAAGPGTIKTVMLASALPGEGVSTVTLGLGLALAEGAPHGVLLVDVHAPHPALTERLGLAPAHGLSELLAGEIPNTQAIAASGIPGVFVLPRGRKPVDLSHPRSLALFEGALGEFRSTFDHVVFDGGSLETAPDALLVAGRADGVVMVVQAERTDAESVQRAAAQFRNAGAKLLGVVLNRRREHLPRFLARCL